MWRCPYCETFNEDTDNICIICGNRRNADPVAATAPKHEISGNFASGSDPVRTSPSRPSNMWDNGDGIGGAVDLKKAAARRVEKKTEREKRDAEIRAKLAAADGGSEKDPNYESMRYADGAASGKKHKGMLAALLMIAAAVVGFVVFSTRAPYAPPAGTDFSLTVYGEVALWSGPGYDFEVIDTLSQGDSMEYLGRIETDDANNEWCRISHNGVIGYVNKVYIDFED